MSQFHQQRLSNGLTVLVETMPHVTGVAVGFLVRTGARDETPADAGVSHFLEHMCFKGTDKRGWRDITIAFDDIGSTYNAMTSKEKTFYYGWVRAGDLARQTELLADMMRSTLPEAEFETEKKVILEEIAMSDDQIDRHLYDLLHEKFFAGHPLRWPVLGTTETIEKLTRAQMLDYFRRRYNAANMVLIIAGHVTASAAMKIAEDVCGHWPAGVARPDRQPPSIVKRGVAVLPMDRFRQQAIAMAVPAPSATDDDNEVAETVASIVGGSNSRFFWKIVQAGIAPVASAYRVDYCDCGFQLLYGFCEPPNAERLVEAIKRELSVLAREGVTEDEVMRVRNRRRTALALEAEAPYHRLMQLAHDLDMFGVPRSVEQRLAELDAVTTDRVHDYLKRWPMDREHYLVSVGPRAWPES